MVALYITVFVLVSVAVIYVFLIMPRVTDAADMELQNTDYALNGIYKDRSCEGTLSAISTARSEGYGVAITVRMTADGRLVVFHERDLKQRYGISSRIRDISYKKLCDVCTSFSKECVPTLSDVLSSIDGHVPLLIEIVSAPNLHKLCARLAESMDRYGGAFSVVSADPRVLAFFKKYRPRFARGQIIYKRYPKGFPRIKAFIIKGMLCNASTRPDFFIVDKAIIKTPAFILATGLFRAQGFMQGVNTLERYDECKRHGMYAVFKNIRP